jgi:hypothetical protein
LGYSLSILHSIYGKTYCVFLGTNFQQRFKEVQNTIGSSAVAVWSVQHFNTNDSSIILETPIMYVIKFVSKNIFISIAATVFIMAAGHALSYLLG